MDQQEPNYRFQLPWILRYPFRVLLLVLLSSMVLIIFIPFGVVASYALTLILSFFLIFYIFLNRMLARLGSVEHRLEARERLLEGVNLRGSERVLDVGCGNGILLMGFAKRLTTGSAIGIDIWSHNSGDNRRSICLKNAEIEGVADRVSIENEDVCDLPYRDGYFNLVSCGLTMHHMKSKNAYEQAISEMKRVLKPRGLIVIYDEPFTILFCAKLLRKAGLEVERPYRDILFAKNI